MLQSNKPLIKSMLKEHFSVVNNVLNIREPFDSIKRVKVADKNVYVLFGDIDYYQNKESILALKRKSNLVSLNDTYKTFLNEAKKRFDSIPELKNIGVVASIETTAPITDEFAKLIDAPYRKHGFLKQDSNFKMKNIPLEKRQTINNLFNLNFELGNESVCVLDDFITTGTSFKNAFNLLPNINSVGVCLFVLNS